MTKEPIILQLMTHASVNHILCVGVCVITSKEPKNYKKIVVILKTVQLRWLKFV